MASFVGPKDKPKNFSPYAGLPDVLTSATSNNVSLEDIPVQDQTRKPSKSKHHRVPQDVSASTTKLTDQKGKTAFIVIVLSLSHASDSAPACTPSAPVRPSQSSVDGRRRISAICAYANADDPRQEVKAEADHPEYRHD